MADEVKACEWVPTGDFDRHDRPYHVCGNCGRGPWAFRSLAVNIACGKAIAGVKTIPGSTVIVIGECGGCGKKSKATADEKPRPVPADYPGAMVDDGE